MEEDTFNETNDTTSDNGSNPTSCSQVQDQDQHQQQDQHEQVSNNNDTTTTCPICLCTFDEEKDDDDDDDKEESLLVSSSIVSGKCHHEFCITCIEHILTVPNPFLLRGNSDNGTSYYYDDNHSYYDYHDHGSHPNEDDDSHLHAPTLGRCPICRSEMSLFDLVWKQKKKKKKPSSSSLPPPITTTMKEDHQFQEEVVDDNNLSTVSAPAVPPEAIIKNYDIIHSSPLQGMIFVEQASSKQLQYLYPQRRPRKGGIGRQSLHFPSSSLFTTTTATTTTTIGSTSTSQQQRQQQELLPYLDLSLDIKDHNNDNDNDHHHQQQDNDNDTNDSTTSIWKLDNGNPLPNKVYFQPGCHYHHKTRTFHGTIQWNKQVQQQQQQQQQDNTNTDNEDCHLFHGSTQWDYILGFSNNFQYISHGLRIVRKSSTNCSNINCKRQECKFILDGIWNIKLYFYQHEKQQQQQSKIMTTTTTTPTTTRTTTIEIRGNQFFLDVRNQNTTNNSSFSPPTTTTKSLPYQLRFPPRQTTKTAAAAEEEVTTIKAKVVGLYGWGESIDFVTTSSVLDWKTRPQGPAIGEVIEWTKPATSSSSSSSNEKDSSSSSKAFKMIWTRESSSSTTEHVDPNIGRSSSSRSSSSSSILQVVPFGPDDIRKRQYHRYIANLGGDTDGDRATAAPIARYYPDTLVGNIFCQAMTVGLASYHFVSDDNAATAGAFSTPTATTTISGAAAEGEDNLLLHEEGEDNNDTMRTGGRIAAYISYEHEQVAQWPPLDNGSPVPSRIWFTNTSFDSTTRTFHGTIDWEGTQYTSWQGDRSWRYEMKFSSKFSCIIGGTVYATPVGGTTDVHERELSIFGEQLLYLNVGLVELFKSQAAARNNNNNITTDDENDNDANQMINNNSAGGRGGGRHHPNGLQRILVEFWGTLREELALARVTVRTFAMLSHLWTSMALRRNISYPSY